MIPDSPDQDFLQLMTQGWIAGYPPWFFNNLIKPANCNTKEQARQLLHFLRSIEDGPLDETRRLLPSLDPNLRLAVGGRTESLLEWAVEKARHPDCIRFLILAGASINAPFLVYKLVNTGKTDLLDEVLLAGADPNVGPEEESALALASWNNSNAVQLLLDAGACTNTTTTVYITNKKQVDKVTPLMIAAYAGQLQIVKLLLKAGADAKAVDASGGTALTWSKISRAKSKAAKIIPLLEQAGATDSSMAITLPETPDFAARAKTPKFQLALNVAKTLTKSTGKSIQLAEGSLAGARAFRIREPAASLSLLDEIRLKVVELGAFVFLSDDIHQMGVSSLVLFPTTDYREAIMSFETPVGQSIDSYELIAWLNELEKLQPFILTHLAPDLLRAKFTTAIQDSSKLAKAIQKICPDVINTSLDEVAKELKKSGELYLWWD